MDLTFKLIPEDLSNYRYAVRDRLTALPGNGIWSKHWVRAGLTIPAGAGTCDPGLFCAQDGTCVKGLGTGEDCSGPISCDANRVARLFQRPSRPAGLKE